MPGVRSFKKEDFVVGHPNVPRISHSVVALTPPFLVEMIISRGGVSAFTALSMVMFKPLFPTGVIVAEICSVMCTLGKCKEKI